jgi:hypothetical protein
MNEPDPGGTHHSLNAITCAEPVVQPSATCSYGAYGDAKLPRDILLREARSEAVQDLSLPGR